MAKKIIFKTGTRGVTDWIKNGKKITSEETLNKINDTIQNLGPIIIEHKHFYGASAPTRKIFENFDDFIDYLSVNTLAGDAIYIWSMYDVCSNENMLTYGKCPDENNLTPEGGAY